MATQPAHLYGGQAVIEGVMIRGRDYYSLAVRRDDGSIEDLQERLNPIYNGRLRRWPLVRGVLALLETLILGIKCLQISADMASTGTGSRKGEGEGIPGWMMATTLAVSLIFGISLFFLLPIGVVRFLEPALGSGLLSEAVEGVLRLAILVGYITAIGMMSDIRRVYAYHGAEHMTVHAYEAGLPLNVDNVRQFGTPHPRCGTAFLLTVVLVSVAVFIAFSLLELSLVVAHRFPGAAVAGNSCGELRGYPLQRATSGGANRQDAGRSGPLAATADHPRAGRRADRGGHPGHGNRRRRRLRTVSSLSL